MSSCFTHFSLHKAQNVDSTANIVKQCPMRRAAHVPVPQSSIKLHLLYYLLLLYKLKASIINKGVESNTSLPALIILMLLILGFYHKCVYIFIVGIPHLGLRFYIIFSIFILLAISVTCYQYFVNRRSVTMRIFLHVIFSLPFGFLAFGLDS